MLDLSQLCSSAEDNIRPGLTRHTALAVEWLEAVETILASLPPSNHQPHLENVQRELMILRLHHDQKWRLSLSYTGTLVNTSALQISCGEERVAPE